MSEELKDLAAALAFADWSEKSGVGQRIANTWIAGALERVSSRIRERLPTNPVDHMEPAIDRTPAVELRAEVLAGSQLQS